MKRILIFLFALMPPSAHAVDTFISAVPTTWRITDYPATNAVEAFFTGSNCANGRVTLPATATVADKNRFFALILAAKISQKTVFIVYDNSNPNCRISSFGMEVP